MDAVVRGFLLISDPTERLFEANFFDDGDVFLEPIDRAFAYQVAHRNQGGFWELAGLLRLNMGKPKRGPFTGYLITMQPRETIVAIEVALDGSSASVGRFDPDSPDPGARAAGRIVRSFAELLAIVLPDVREGDAPPLAAA